MTLTQFLLWFAHAACNVYSPAKPPKGELVDIIDRLLADKTTAVLSSGVV